VEANGYRAHLRSVIAASVAPHGYTLTLWTSGAIAIRDAGGVPSVAEILLLLCGAVAGFGAVGLLAYGSFGEQIAVRPKEVRMWAGLHLFTVGVCVLAVYAVTALIPGWPQWPAVGFVATAGYLLVIGAQFRLASRFPVRESRTGRL